MERISENKVFVGALTISCLMHVGMLARFSYTTTHDSQKPLPKPEMIYQPMRAVVVKKESSTKEKESYSHQRIQTLPEKKFIKPPQGLRKDEALPIGRLREIPQMSGAFKLDKRQPRELDSKSLVRKITIAAIQSEKISNPTYINYYQIIRNKIKNRAYINYSQMESGEVYLTFVLLSNGSLKQLKLIEERTSANGFLKGIGLKSIQEASPFPSFPKDLKYPELTFNVVISFEVKD